MLKFDGSTTSGARSCVERAGLRGLHVLGGTVLVAVTLAAPSARADVTLAEADGWTVFTNGRIGAFLGYTNGDPVPPNAPDPNRPGMTLQMAEAGRNVSSNRAPQDPDGHHQSLRLRSGFVGNVLGFGVRKPVGGDTSLQVYLHLHGVIEPADQRKWRVIEADMREGYFALESPTWGSFWAGRSGSLFSRGATQITFDYGFRYSLGVPASVDNVGPGVGHIGYGVLASNFAPGMVYTTPSLAGARLSLGVFDSNNLAGQWERTMWPRPEAELTWGLEADSFLVHLFANGAWQKIYQSGSGENATVWGAGYGGRIEIGPVHLGLAGHYGVGLGLDFAFQPGAATAGNPDQNYELRTFDGYYAQLQLVLGQVDLAAGVGMTRVHLLDSDLVDSWIDDDSDTTTPTVNDDANPAQNDPVGYNNYKQQIGVSAGVVYHATDYLHVSLDVFRAQHEWYLGDRKQTLYFVNLGPTVDW